MDKRKTTKCLPNVSITSIGLSAALLAGCSTSIESSQPQSTQHISQGVYEVEYASAAQFNVAMDALHQQALQYCDNDTSLGSVEQAWQQGMQQWMWLQGQERGPMLALEQNWNIQFWPDKKNTTGRKMAAASKQSSWSVSEVKNESVTVQGLGAVEWMLFDVKGRPSIESKSNCSLLSAITGSLAERSATMLTAWSENPWQALDEKAWHAEYLALQTNQLDYTMKKLSRPLAKIGAAKPYFSESWRAKTSMTNIKSNVEALQALYLANGQGLDSILRHSGDSRLADSIKQQFVTLLDTWPENPSLFELLQDKDGYRAALSQYNKLEQLKYLISEEAAVKLGIVIGFNATDGD